MRIVLVPLDGSSLSRSALTHARGLAARAGAELRLIYVREAPATERSSVLVESEGKEAYVRNLAGRLKVPLHVAKGQAGTEIANYAEAIQADLVAIGTHGRRGLSRWLLGSVADQVRRHAPCPVLTVRSSAAGQSSRYRRILVPLDGSEQSELSLGPACWLARHDHSELFLLRVGAAREDGLLARLRSLYLQVAGGPGTGTRVADILEHERDLTVMSGNFLGDLTGQVVHRARSPVLVVRGTGSLMRQEV